MEIKLPETTFNWVSRPTRSGVKTKLQETTHKFTIPVFSHYEVHVILTNNIAASRAKRDKIMGRSTDKLFEQTDAMHDSGLPGHSFLYFDTRHMTTGVIAHECWHVIWSMFGYFGVNFENETVAYHLDYLVDQVVKTIRRKENNDRRRQRKTAVSTRSGRRRNSPN